MKTLIAGTLIAATMALAVPTPASAIGIVIGPRGGVGVRVGGFGYRGGYRGYGWHGGAGWRGGYAWRGGRRVWRR